MRLAMTDPARMRAAFFPRAQAIEVREVPVPEPGPDEVRLRVRFCGVCGSDVSLYKTGALAGPEVVLGHEVAAEVDLDPSGTWAPGARVVPFPARGCGRCLWCLEGEWRYCERPPPVAGGGFAELTLYPERNLIAIPDAVDDRAAAAAEPLGVGIRAALLAGVGDGDLVYVSGLGSIGLFTVAALVAAGCRAAGADPREERRSLAAGLGCTAVFDNTTEDPVAATLALDPHGPRAAFECAGVPASLEQVIETCGFGGTVGIVGIPVAPVLLLRMTLKEQRAFSIAGPTVASMRRALELLRERPDIARVVTGVVTLDALGDTMAALAEGRGGVKVLVDPRS